ncbi:MAG TPA: hypothetical protein VJC09_00920 [Candidatus Saccharimonadales bacterium]|nr:hypothetical protein [Candidatus Saccharimonadales bacterium]
MAVVRRIVPQSVKSRVIKFVDDRWPDGPVRRNLANMVSGGGAAAVAIGAVVGGKFGVALRSGGELADDVDGDFAHTFGGTKNGKKVDATLDKVKMAIEIARLWHDSAKLNDDERPKRRIALGFIASKHLINATLNLTAEAKGLDPSSSMAGRINIWVDGFACAAFGVSDVIKNEKYSKAAAAVGYVATAIGVPTGLVTTYGYMNQFRGGEPVDSDRLTLEEMYGPEVLPVEE